MAKSEKEKSDKKKEKNYKRKVQKKTKKQAIKLAKLKKRGVEPFLEESEVCYNRVQKLLKIKAKIPTALLWGAETMILEKTNNDFQEILDTFRELSTYADGPIVFEKAMAAAVKCRGDTTFTLEAYIELRNSTSSVVNVPTKYLRPSESDSMPEFSLPSVSVPDVSVRDVSMIVSVPLLSELSAKMNLGRGSLTFPAVPMLLCR